MRLVYLSCPYGGDAANLHRAIGHLVWAHESSPWGLWVQAPWIASAMAEAQRGTTEARWRAMGGILVEGRVLDGYDALLHMGVPSPQECTTGMIRDARHMVRAGKQVYQLIQGDIRETTRVWEHDSP